jgi:spermidine synthase
LNRLLLKMTVGMTGAMIMLIELIGTRVISPYYGNTLFTWTSLISTAMVSLALGYYLGGRLADRKANTETLYTLIFIAGITILAIPKFSYFALTWTNVLGARLGSLACSLILFSVPLTLLAMVVPYALKLDLTKLENVGVTAGQLYAISTLGSVFGTIFTGFFLIPSFPVSTILLSAGLILSFVSMAQLILQRKRKMIFFLLMIVLMPGMESVKPLHERSGHYGTIKVIEKGDLRYLLVDGSSQGCIYKSSNESCFGYVHEITHRLEPEDKVLLIGLGAGSLAKKFRFDDIIEIDQDIGEVAEEYFGYEGEFIIDDGRHYIRTTDKAYDAIILDAFSGYGIAGHLISLDAFIEAKKIMVPGGTLIVNTLGTEESVLQSYIYATLKGAFSNVSVMKIGSGIPNYIFYASDGEVPRTDNMIAEGEIITDDHNPTEFLSLEVGEKWRAENLEWFGNEII